MRQRLLTLTKKHSLFLFGARGVGKSTLIENTFNLSESLVINLLNPIVEDRLARDPMELVTQVKALSAKEKYVVIDEIQKLPKLLDVVHLLIETEKCGKYFILTGSSARKLKMSGVNLLAGRAFVYHLYPFSFLECDDAFNLNTALSFGMLPAVYYLDTHREKQQFLEAYALTYLKEEIWAEHIVKELDPFRRFLEVAAQANAKIINYSNIAKDVGADDKTVKNYFSILEDTLLGVMLEPYHHSFRKRLKSAPKFYFFDIGVMRALSRMLMVPPKTGTSYYGELFESFVVTECMKLASYFHSDYKFSYLQTGAGVEIDLVVERPGKPLLLIEIKSADKIWLANIHALQQIGKELGHCEMVCFSNEPRRKKLNDVIVWNWRQGIQHYFE